MEQLIKDLKPLRELVTQQQKEFKKRNKENIAKLKQIIKKWIDGLEMNPFVEQRKFKLKNIRATLAPIILSNEFSILYFTHSKNVSENDIIEYRKVLVSVKRFCEDNLIKKVDIKFSNKNSKTKAGIDKTDTTGTGTGKKLDSDKSGTGTDKKLDSDEGGTGTGTGNGNSKRKANADLPSNKKKNNRGTLDAAVPLTGFRGNEDDVHVNVDFVKEK